MSIKRVSAGEQIKASTINGLIDACNGFNNDSIIGRYNYALNNPRVYVRNDTDTTFLVGEPVGVTGFSRDSSSYRDIFNDFLNTGFVFSCSRTLNAFGVTHIGYCLESIRPGKLGRISIPDITAGYVYDSTGTFVADGHFVKVDYTNNRLVAEVSKTSPYIKWKIIAAVYSGPNYSWCAMVPFSPLAPLLDVSLSKTTGGPTVSYSYPAEGSEIRYPLISDVLKTRYWLDESVYVSVPTLPGEGNSSSSGSGVVDPTAPKTYTVVVDVECNDDGDLVVKYGTLVVEHFHVVGNIETETARVNVGGVFMTDATLNKVTTP